MALASGGLGILTQSLVFIHCSRSCFLPSDLESKGALQEQDIVWLALQQGFGDAGWAEFSRQLRAFLSLWHFKGFTNHQVKRTPEGPLNLTPASLCMVIQQVNNRDSAEVVPKCLLVEGS